MPFPLAELGNYSTHSTDECKSATCTSLPPGSQVKSICMEVAMDKMYECTIKICAHTPCTECIHNLCHYPVCSGYIRTGS